MGLYIQLYDSKTYAVWVEFEMLAALSCQFETRQVHNKQPVWAPFPFILKLAGEDVGMNEGKVRRRVWMLVFVTLHDMSAKNTSLKYIGH